MARVIFLNCVDKAESPESTKLLYQQANLLNEGGIEAKIFQPDGFPEWLDDGFSQSLHCREIFLNSDDVVVFPLAAFEKLEAPLRAKWPCKKIFYCHDPYLMVMKGINVSLLKEWDILKVLVPNKWGRDKLKSFMNLDHIDIIPPYVEIKKDFLTSKSLTMAVYLEYDGKHSNTPFTSELGIFSNKYPDYSKRLQWQNLSGKTESFKMEYLRKAPLSVSFLSLETTGLKELEAMAVGSLVCAPLGGGNSDYARQQNGMWFSFEDIESLSDMIFRSLEGFESQSVSYQRQRNEGFRTASFYTRQIVKDVVTDIYKTFIRD